MFEDDLLYCQIQCEELPHPKPCHPKPELPLYARLTFRVMLPEI